MNNIPSDEDFKRAEAADRERNRGLSEVSENIINRFQQKGVHNAFLFYSPDNDIFGAYIFYQWDHQIEEAEKSGLSLQIKDAVFEELERVGRGDRNLIKVDVEFDSDENVTKNYEGDYYLRLR